MIGKVLLLALFIVAAECGVLQQVAAPAYVAAAPRLAAAPVFSAPRYAAVAAPAAVYAGPRYAAAPVLAAPRIHHAPAVYAAPRVAVAAAPTVLAAPRVAVAAPVVQKAVAAVYPEVPQPYSYGYSSQDEYGSQIQKEEVGDGSGAVRGTYGYTDPSGIYRQVDYVADAYGFRANVRTNEPGTAPSNPADVNMEAAPVEVVQKTIAAAPVVKTVAAAPVAVKSFAAPIYGAAAPAYKVGY